MQAQSGQVSNHAEQGQPVLGGASWRAGHAPQQLGALLQVSDLWKQEQETGQKCEQTTRSGVKEGDGGGVVGLFLTLNGVDHVGLQRGWQDGTGEILQEPDHPVTQGRHLQLLQV